MNTAAMALVPIQDLQKFAVGDKVKVKIAPYSEAEWLKVVDVDEKEGTVGCEYWLQTRRQEVYFRAQDVEVVEGTELKVQRKAELEKALQTCKDVGRCRIIWQELRAIS